VRAAPVAGNGRIYFHTATGEITALDRGGRRLWSRTSGPGPNPEPLRAPLLFSDGLVVAGSREGMLRALDADTGRDRWLYRVGADVQASANRVPGSGKAPGGIVVVSQPDGVLHLVDPRTGKALWRSAPTNRCDGPPAVGGGLVAYGNCDAAFHLFDAATGRRLRTVPLGPDRQVFTGVALADGRLYGGDRSGRLTCLDAGSGRVLWVSEAARKEVSTPPAVSPDHVVYGADDGRLYTLDRASGRLLWSADAGPSPVSPIVAGDKVVATAGGAVLLLRLADGRLLWRETLSDEITAPTLAAGLVVVGTEDGFVAAYGSAPAGGAGP
jgi:outer membrane protein assembly factor BamB